MPPSPSLRCSTGREHRAENNHKRGRSFESGLILRAKDDDLALFNDMQTKERDNFLLHTSDDFDDSLTKLRYSSDFKLGITIPVRGESSDMLNVEGEKNDYDWLLTPPDTPLFPSLDDDEPQLHNLPPRGRLRSQPINIAKSPSFTEKTQRANRTSASPHRLSPSPRSSNSFSQMKARPSSAPRTSPPPISRSTTPSRRPCTPPSKPSTPTPRSLTPTLRRMSTGSSGQTSSSGRKGTSPVRSSRGNSASPKLGGWQTNLPGFSSDAPPNLRTSLSDRPIQHMRGVSPTSRNGRGRQSMSPTASRSASSSHSHERDRFSSYSKGSVASSGDDDVDSLHSMAISCSPPARKNGMSVNNKPMILSKKTSRASSASSVPKRSFDSVLRQMDQRKTPQNMFRPLLSSVPATTFYVGKANNMHRPMFSRNSSLTTSTSASSEQGASVAPDMEVGEHEQNDLSVEWERKQDPDTQEELFIFENVDDINEAADHELSAGKFQRGRIFDEGMTSKVISEELKGSMSKFGDTAGIATAAGSICATGDCSVVDDSKIMETCSKCGRRLHIVVVNGMPVVCEECAEIDGLFAAGEHLVPSPLTYDETIQSEVAIGMDRRSNELQFDNGVPESLGKSCSEVIADQHERKIEKGPDCLGDSPLQLRMDKRESHLSTQQLDSQHEMSSTTHSESKFGQIEHTAHLGLRVDNPEGTGISVLLLQRSSSSKWPVVQGRACTATSILCSEPSYARDNTSMMKRSFGRDSASASSSVDLGSSRQTDRIQRQLSNRKSEVVSVRSDSDMKVQCTGSLDNLEINASKPLIVPKSETEENLTNFDDGMEYIRESMLGTEEHGNSAGHRDMSATNSSSIRQDCLDGDEYSYADSCMVVNASDSQLLNCPKSTHSETLAANSLTNEDCSSCNGDGGPLKANESSFQNIEGPIDIPSSVIGEEHVLNDSCRSDMSDAATTSSGVILESKYNCDNFSDLQVECAPSEVPSNVDVLHEHSVSTSSEKGVFVSNSEYGTTDHVHGISEESTVILESPRGHVPRSFTLEEATDTILFCSSIIHDIAYKAASIGMENELKVTSEEASRPTVMILGKSLPDQDSRKMSNKRTPKSQKFKRKRLVSQNKSTTEDLGNNVIAQESIRSNAEIPKKAVDSVKPPKLESKCNCTVM